MRIKLFPIDMNGFSSLNKAENQDDSVLVTLH